MNSLAKEEKPDEKRAENGVYSPKRRKRKMNDLSGKTWTTYSVSVWDIVKSSAENRTGHPAMFPVELCKRLIEIYTKPGDTVIDPFMGSGSVLVAARELGRKGVGFEINQDFIEMAKKRLSHASLSTMSVTLPVIYDVDASGMSQYLDLNSMDLCITSPPYWDILRQKRTADYKKIRPYSDTEADLGNIEDYQMFIDALESIFEKVYEVLKTGKHCVVIAMDLRKKDKFYPFHIDIADMMQGIGFKFEDIIIWDRKKEYNNLRPLGYPFVFRVNKVHEYIQIFKKT